jgi:hypothetical protein
MDMERRLPSGDTYGWSCVQQQISHGEKEAFDKGKELHVVALWETNLGEARDSLEWILYCGAKTCTPCLEAGGSILFTSLREYSFYTCVRKGGVFSHFNQSTVRLSSP